MLKLFEQDWRSLWGEDLPDEGVGAVYTLPHIVSLILDLSGFDPFGADLSMQRTLEPSCGGGAFTLPIVERILDSREHHHGSIDWQSNDLETALLCVDISTSAIEASSERVRELLTTRGCPASRARELVSNWFEQTDFLLTDHGSSRFDFILGNPPYVRIEHLPKPVLQAYRERFPAAGERSDAYIFFIEQALQLLSDDGHLGFICANRFAKNRYGEGIRRLISRDYHVRWYLNLEHTQPFEEVVSAYPAILVIDQHRDEETLAATIEDLEDQTLEEILEVDADPSISSDIVSRFANWYPDGSPWISTRIDESSLLDEISRRYPTLEASGAGTRVGIGVATGADEVFVLDGRDETIEADRQLPLVLSRHIDVDKISWDGTHVINPFEGSERGQLVDLGEHPGFAGYFHRHEDRLRSRYVARKRPDAWYRTIDRIHPHLMELEKLVIPDIQSGGVVGYDSGEFYPHHNVYFITSEGWDLRLLQAILRSSFVRDQIQAHSVQMRGGSLRYQAGTLRKVHVPHVESIPGELVDELRMRATDADVGEIDRLLIPFIARKRTAA